MSMLSMRANACQRATPTHRGTSERCDGRPNGGVLIWSAAAARCGGLGRQRGPIGLDWVEAVHRMSSREGPPVNKGEMRPVVDIKCVQ